MTDDKAQMPDEIIVRGYKDQHGLRLYAETLDYGQGQKYVRADLASGERVTDVEALIDEIQTAATNENWSDWGNADNGIRYAVEYIYSRNLIPTAQPVRDMDDRKAADLANAIRKGILEVWPNFKPDVGRLRTIIGVAVQQLRLSLPQSPAPDQGHLHADTEDGFNRFVEMLEREPQYKPRLAALLRSTTPCPHNRIDHNLECLDCDEPVYIAPYRP